MKAEQLTTEYLTNPLGLDVTNPRLAWKCETATHPVRQSGYQIQVASQGDLLSQNNPDLWDSEKVQSSESVGISYAGKPLQSDLTCYWRVRLWENDKTSPGLWSDIAYWSMGLLDADLWKARWIGLPREEKLEHIPPRYLRKSFPVHRNVRRAVVYSTALGVYELHLNGSRINDLFAPGWTDYNQRVQYWTHDVTDIINGQTNVLAVLLGSGWYAGHVGMTGTCWYGDTPRCLVQLQIEFDDGSTELITSDETWKVTTGGLEYSDMIMGERYDARRAYAGWTEVGFDDSDWKNAESGTYDGRLVAALEPPIKVNLEVEPVHVTKTDRNTYIFDMGQNMVGWAQVSLRGPSGNEVELSYGEMLRDDGSLYVDNLRAARQRDYYIQSGVGTETYEPHFTFHGFRFVEITGYPGVPRLEDVRGKVVHSEMPERGSIETSDPMINKLFRNVTWSQRGNFLSIPTDCPQRDERLGWTGDAQIFARTATYNMDVERLLSKYLHDVADAQKESGAFPDVAPDGGWDWYKTTKKPIRWLAPDNAGWGDAGVIIPWTLYLVYKDVRVLNTMYPHIVRWIDYLLAGATDFIRPDHGDYGDWLSINSYTPNEVVQTAYFAYSTKIATKIAGVLGKIDDAQRFETLFDNISHAFQQKFVDPDGRITGDSQTAYILALRFGLLSDNQKAQALQHLTSGILSMDTHLSTGFLGVGHVLPVLSDNGFDDIAFSLLRQDTFPSWLYSVRHGATTIWERWDGWTEDHGFQNPETNSFNHYALGSVVEWMYRYMLGIDADEDDPAYKRIVIRPRIGGNLEFAKGTYETIYGAVFVGWEISGSKRALEVRIPANSEADVYLPCTPGTEIQGPAGAHPVREDGHPESVYHVGSGTYRFTWTDEGTPAK